MINAFGAFLKDRAGKGRSGEGVGLIEKFERE